ncbi:MAG: 4-(cytidine 5'-diphospho)-2-C-methyl-D-erythritol kinase [Planctomycetia bacterium]|nr:4-(cytidine 5'-diphospho)-2-C-methyl-D-erythritol kinase [Planctomycetia bacterium]
MRIERHADGVDVQAPAKVNLFLEVLGKRPDGYHEIATLMCAVSLFDTLELRHDESGEVRLSCDLPGLETGAGNLVCQAAAVLRRHSGCTRGARLHLKKRIPLAAGLAGGSSDAAAALAGLNELWQLGLSAAELARLGAEVGSDVAFFFATPAAWCTGRGEIVTPAPVGRTLDLLLLCPGVGLPTASVYRGVTVPDQPADGADIRQALAVGDVEQLGGLLHNRLQLPAEQLCPEVAAWQARLTALQPAGAAMSGSGSSLFALCRDRQEALRIARELSSQPLGWNTAGGPNLVLVQSCV